MGLNGSIIIRIETRQDDASIIRKVTKLYAHGLSMLGKWPASKIMQDTYDLSDGLYEISNIMTSDGTYKMRPLSELIDKENHDMYGVRFDPDDMSWMDAFKDVNPDDTIDWDSVPSIPPKGKPYPWTCGKCAKKAVFPSGNSYYCKECGTVHTSGGH